MNIDNYISSGIIEMYVMGLCSEEEKKEIESLRMQYPALDAAIRRYEAELEEKMQKNITLPSPDVDEKILQTIDSLRPGNKNTASYDAPIRRLYWRQPLAAAVIILLIVSISINYLLYQKTRNQERDPEKAGSTLPLSDYAVLINPAITPVALYGVGIHTICRCTLFWDKKTGKAYLFIHHLPKLSGNSYNYQLWAMVNNVPVSVGIINDAIRGKFIEMQNVPANAIAFSVTLEKAGGSATPTVAETYLEGKI